MTDTDSLDDERLRKAIRATASEPSSTHDQQILRAAQAFTEEHEHAKPTGARPGLRTESNQPRWPLALAAAMVLGIALLWLLPTVTPKPDVTRGAAERVVPQPDADLTQAPNRFDWSAELADGEFQLVLMGADASPLWTSPWQANSELVVPPELATQLANPGTYLWLIYRRNPTHPPLGPFRFSVEP